MFYGSVEALEDLKNLKLILFLVDKVKLLKVGEHLIKHVEADKIYYFKFEA